MKVIRDALNKVAQKEKADFLPRFFKTGKGEYGEGDVFLGVMVPNSRKIAKQFLELNLEELVSLLGSKIHEERLVALLILVEKYARAEDGKAKKKIVDFYLKHKYAVNNWDLVDLSAAPILGDYLLDKKRDLLYDLANSPNLWDRRIAVVSTYAFIREKQFDDTLSLCKHFLSDKQDLIHKACGWMLREVGKRDEAILEHFLKKNHSKMPRTMLRYAIERFPEKTRKNFLNGNV